MEEPKKNKPFIYNILFVLVCGGLFLFLWNAPQETTTTLPNDDDHLRFMNMNKKEAEKSCEECHFVDGPSPLPAEHPPKYRCLFCHKRKPQPS